MIDLPGFDELLEHTECRDYCQLSGHSRVIRKISTVMGQFESGNLPNHITNANHAGLDYPGIEAAQAELTAQR